MAQNDTERHRTAQNECKLKKLMSINEAQNHNKGTKRHRMKLNENEKAKNSPELLKR